jgi:hypothetical protein
MFGTNPDGTGPDAWGRPESSQLYGTVPLKPVMEWVFNRYHVKFTDGEHGPVVRERDFIGVDGPNIERDFDPEWGGMRFPHNASYYHWEIVEENVHVRRWQTSMGVRVEGDGWLDCRCVVKECA